MLLSSALVALKGTIGVNITKVNTKEVPHYKLKYRVVGY